MNATALPRPGQRLWTYLELCAKMDETNQPVELWHGRLVMAPSPFIPHQIVVARLHEALRHWVSRHRLGLVIPAPMDVVLDSRLMVQPDLLFIAKDRKNIMRGHVYGAPDLVMEVVSPDRRKRDYKDKKDQYEAHGVREYWIVDPDREHIEFWSLNEDSFFDLVGRFTGRQRAESKVLAGFKVQVDEILEDPLKM